MRTSGNLLRAILSRDHVCPWWLAYSFDNRLRRFIHRPERLLGPYVRQGMTVLDVGCGMGHFSLGLARLVGSDGRVIAVDLQPEMLEVLSARANKEGLDERIRLHRCQKDELGVDVAADFILTFWMAHEVGRLESFMDEIYTLLKDGGNYFLAEPIVHVSAEKFRRLSDAAVKAGFQICDEPRVRLSRALVFGK
ncbi:MAG: class I SAM-dependent methyltransferase [Thermoanaerobaculia bacterium]